MSTKRPEPTKEYLKRFEEAMASIKGWKSPAVVRVAMDCRRDHVRQHRRRSDGGLPLDWYVVLAKAEAAGVSAEDIADAIAPNFLFPDIV